MYRALITGSGNPYFIEAQRGWVTCTRSQNSRAEVKPWLSDYKSYTINHWGPSLSSKPFNHSHKPLLKSLLVCEQFKSSVMSRCLFSKRESAQTPFITLMIPKHNWLVFFLIERISSAQCSATCSMFPILPRSWDRPMWLLLANGLSLLGGGIKTWCSPLAFSFPLQVALEAMWVMVLVQLGGRLDLWVTAWRRALLTSFIGTCAGRSHWSLQFVCYCHWTQPYTDYQG